MGSQTVLPYVAPILPFLLSAIDQWPRWLKERKKIQLLLRLLTLIVAWALVYVASEQGARANRDAAALSEQRRVENQDLESRLVATVELARLTAEGCISDPKLRQKAKAVHPKLQRGASEELHFSDKATVVVKRAPEKRPEPLKPKP